MGDIAKTIRTHLINSATITGIVDVGNIFVSNSPKAKATKQIVIKEIPGPSNSVLDLEQGNLNLIVVVDGDKVSEPYAETKTIVEAILDLLNKKNETLLDTDSAMRWLVKSGVDYIYNQDEYYWMAVITFGYVEGGITE